MWFRSLSLILATVCVSKAAVALIRPAAFYGWRQGQYGSGRPPGVVLVAPVATLLLAGTAWYATLYHYQRGGWIVTSFLTLVAALGAANLVRWSAHRATVSRAIAHPARRTAVDLLLLLLGLFFLALALLLF